MGTHNWYDMREFIEFLKTKQDIVYVKDEVTPRLVGSLQNITLAQDGPAIMFENVKGANYPMFVSSIGCDRRFLWAMGVDTWKEYNLEFERRTKELIPPRIVEDAPCQECSIEEKDIDINKICNVIWHAMDQKPFSGTLSLCITKDPDTGVQNAGIYRHENYDSPSKTLGMGAPAYTHGRQHLMKYEKMNKPMPFALAVGVDPITLCCGGCRTSPGVDEFWLAGALREEPLDMVKCKTSDILVPATAEWIFEGVVQPGATRHEESEWFGEFTGHYGEARELPLMEVKLITHRKNPFYQGTREQWHGESEYLEGKMSQGFAFKTLRSLVPGILDLRSCKAYEAVVQINKLFKGHPQQVMDAVWGATYARYKHVYVCDADTDIWDFDSVHWALATRVSADRDVTITKRRAGQWLDPAMPLTQKGWQSGMGVDVTMKNEEYEFWGDKVPRTVLDPEDTAMVRGKYPDLVKQILNSPLTIKK